MKRFVLARITYVAAYTAGWVHFQTEPSIKCPEITWSPVLWQMLIGIVIPYSSRLALTFHKEASIYRIRTNEFSSLAISICFPSWSSKLSAPPAWKWAG